MTKIFGILNITLDSFSDGGKYFHVKNAISYGKYLYDLGVDYIDIGGQSTAPNRKEISIQEELDRVLLVIESLISMGIKNLSIDTYRSKVALEAIKMGVKVINDQGAALKDENMMEAYLKADLVVVMHQKGNLSGVFQGEKVFYQDVLLEIKDFFKERLSTFLKHGVDLEKIVVDPGIGFGKGLKDTLKIIKNVSFFKDLNQKILIGLSRKSFIGHIIDEVEPQNRDFANLILEYECLNSQVDYIRTHNVKALIHAIKIRKVLMDENIY